MSALIVNYDKEKHKKFINEVFRDDDARKFFNVRGYKDESHISLDNYSFLLIAEQGGFPVGFIKVSYQPMSCRGYVDCIYVQGPYREHGISKVLLSNAEEKAQEYYPVKGMYMFTIENEKMEKMLEGEGYMNKGAYKEFIYREGKYRKQTLFIKKF